MKTFLVFAILLIVSCQRQASTNLRQMPPTDVVLENKEIKVTARKKCPTNNPNCQTPQPPPVTSSGKGCLLLDFNGQLISGTLWNTNGDVYCNTSGLTATAITNILERVKHDYSFEDSLIITTDEAVFNSYPKYKRMRIVITTSWEWYGYVGGVAYINSFNWDDDSPCFVFSSLLGLNEKYISDATSHEGYHTFGGRHNSEWDENCNKVNEYLVGDLIPGNSYSSPNPVFGVAPNSICCTCVEDAMAVIKNSINF